MLTFYKKRFFSIVPLYWAVGALFTAFSFFLNRKTFLQNLALFPIEFFGAQSVFSSLFGFSHNGGTWFISCILICYLVFPLLNSLQQNFCFWQKIFCICFCALMLLYSPLVVHFFKIQSIYSNPFFRLCEFAIGVLLCSIVNEDIPNVRFARFLKATFENWMAFALECFVLFFAVTFFVRKNFAVGNYMLYNWIALPVFSFMLLTLQGIHSKRLLNSKTLKYFSKISYAFFLAQFFVWKPTAYFFAKCGFKSNATKIVFSFLLCGAVAIFLCETIESPLKKIAQDKFFKNEKN